jgi:hypothetical protein
VYLPQLLLLQADIARARKRVADARACARRGVEEARAQESPWHELAALVALCELSGADAADRQALAALLAALPEVADTALAARARAQLA